MMEAASRLERTHELQPAKVPTRNTPSRRRLAGERKAPKGWIAVRDCDGMRMVAARSVVRGKAQ